MTPGRVSSPDRAPPPTVSRASSTWTSTPLRASWMAPARPLGPAPTTTALVISAASRHRRRASLARDVASASGRVDGELVARLGPGLAAQHVLDSDIALLDHPGVGVDDAIPLA